MTIRSLQDTLIDIVKLFKKEVFLDSGLTFYEPIRQHLDQLLEVTKQDEM